MGFLCSSQQIVIAHVLEREILTSKIIVIFCIGVYVFSFAELNIIFQFFFLRFYV